MRKKVDPNSIKVSYRQVNADPREIERRLGRAFGILFDKVMMLDNPFVYDENIFKDPEVIRKINGLPEYSNENYYETGKNDNQRV